MRNLKVGLAQTASKLGSVRLNARNHIALIEKANDEEVDIVSFPELSLPGYSLKDLAYEVVDEGQRALKGIAQRTIRGRRAICGLVTQDALGLIRNSAAVLGDGKVLGTTSKFFLPTYGLFEELRYFVPGDPRTELRVFEGGGCRFGVVICEDAWHPEPIQALARLGADVVFCLASSPARGVGRPEQESGLPIQARWLSLLKAHALMNNVFVAFVNRAGPEDEEFFWGGSTLVSPTGDVLAKAKNDEPDWVTATIDLDDVKRARRFSSFKDYRPEFHEVLRDL